MVYDIQRCMIVNGENGKWYTVENDRQWPISDNREYHNGELQARETKRQW